MFPKCLPKNRVNPKDFKIILKFLHCQDTHIIVQHRVNSNFGAFIFHVGKLTGEFDKSFQNFVFIALCNWKVNPETQLCDDGNSLDQYHFRSKF